MNSIETTVTPAINLSDYQKRFCRRALDMARGVKLIEAPDLRHIILDAKAGSGKTSTITFLMKYLGAPYVLRNLKIIALMFNKRNAVEIQPKLPKGGYAEGTTTNAFGGRICRKNGAGRLPNDDEKPKMIQILSEMQMTFVERKLGPQIRKLVSIAKSAGLAPKMNGVYPLLADTPEAWAGFIEHYGVDFDESWQEEKAIDFARQALRRSIDIADRIIDFDDQLYLPIVMRMGFPKYDWVFIDEAQDTNCHPPGTLVRKVIGRASKRCGGRTTIHEDVPIESLKNGDRVVAWAKRWGKVVAEGMPVKVGKRHFHGKLVEMTCGEKTVPMTPDHRLYAMLNGDGEDRFLVYLMWRGDRGYRVGQCALRYCNKVDSKHKAMGGLGARFADEKAEKGWILEVCATRGDALAVEQILSCRYGIPMTRFEPCSADSATTREIIGRVFAEVRGSGAQCLADRGLSVDLPLYQNQKSARRMPTKRYFEIFAANLLPGIMSIPSQEPFKQVKISAVTRRQYSGPVYSLDVTRWHTYIANDLIVKNCVQRELVKRSVKDDGHIVAVGDEKQAIYGFRGAGTDSMQVLKSELGAHVMPLSICYRCDKAIVREAQRIVPAIEVCPDRGEGKVDSWTAIMNRQSALPEAQERLAFKGAPSAEILKAFTAESVILCPMNAPLVTAALGFIRNKIACQMLGRDFSKGLVKLLEKLEALDAQDAEKRLSEYEKEETERLAERQQESKLQALADKCATLRAFLADAAPNEKIDRIVATIQGLFTREGADDGKAQSQLTLCSIHKSKGGEWPRVFLLESSFLQSTIGYKGKQLLPWEVEQRRNLLYVGITRAEHELIYLSKDDLEALL